MLWEYHSIGTMEWQPADLKFHDKNKKMTPL